MFAHFTLMIVAGQAVVYHSVVVISGTVCGAMCKPLHSEIIPLLITLNISITMHLNLLEEHM